MAAPPWSFASPQLDPGIVRHEDERREVANRSVLGSLRERVWRWAERLERRLADPRALT